MRLSLFAICFLLFALCSPAQDESAKLIPVNDWPRVIYADGKQIVNPSAATCVAAGYRLIPAKPATPEGMLVVSESLVQDDKKADSVQWVIEYADKPAPPPPPPPEILTNVPAERVSFAFTTSGVFRVALWLDAPVITPVTNKVANP